MQVQQAGGWISYAIPLVVIAVVMAIRWKRMSRVRPLKLERLWILPTLYAVVIGFTFSRFPPQGWGWLFCLIALVLGARPGRAFRAGLTIGIAFIGINLVLGLMLTTLGGVAQAIVTNTGMQRDIVDVGWPSAAAIAFGSSVGLWVIPIGILVNVVLLFSGLTRTLNVDVWNFWHFAFVGSLVVAATLHYAWWRLLGQLK